MPAPSEHDRLRFAQFYRYKSQHRKRARSARLGVKKSKILYAYARWALARRAARTSIKRVLHSKISSFEGRNIPINWGKQPPNKHTAYAIQSDKGVTKVITVKRTVGEALDPSTWIVRGAEEAERFHFRCRGDADFRLAEDYQLMDPSTGAISLRSHYLEITLPKVQTRDQHDFKVKIFLHLHLDAERLLRCFDHVNVADALLRRVEAKVRAAITSRKDENVHRDAVKIPTEVMGELMAGENADREALESWTRDKGVAANGDTSEYFAAQQARNNALGFVIDSIDIIAEEIAEVPDWPLEVGGENNSAPPPSALRIETKHLDRIRDLFLYNPGVRTTSEENGHAEMEPTPRSYDEYREANEALLEVMRMHTAENIARAYAREGHVIIVPTSEMASVKGGVYRMLPRELDEIRQARKQSEDRS